MILLREAREAVRIVMLREKSWLRAATAMLMALVLLAAGRNALAGELDKVDAFDIQAQALTTALLQFAAQAHVQISMESNARFRALRSETLKGNFTGRVALVRLLSGTSLHFVEQGNRITIIDAGRPTTIRPRAAAVGDTDGPAHIPYSQEVNHGTTASGSKGRKAPNAPPMLGEVIVTGTHIQGAPQSSPVITITRQEIDRSGYTAIGDLIGSLPEDFGNSGPQTLIASSPNANQSPSAAPAPNLLGLGPESTLTLINGQRLAVDSITGAVDISLIPMAVVDHVDVLTGGASAVYGSDAVAGVVNIVLKQNFNGAKTTLLGAGTADGGGTERDFNQMLGKKWGTGGVIFDYEFDKIDPVWASQRDITKTASSSNTPVGGASRNSFFVSSRQSLGSVSAFAEGLYTYRIERYESSSGPPYAAQNGEVGVHQYAVNGGLNAALPAGWNLALVGDFSEERTLDQTTLVPGGPQPAMQYEGQTRSAEATANGPVLDLPSGIMRGAIGAGYRVDTYNETSEGVSYLPGARRTVRYAYAEANIPLIRSSDENWHRSLALDLSGRYESYSDFGSESVPKIGLVYVPFGTIKVRGTWGKSFRAPSLFQLYNQHGLLYYPLPDPHSATGVSDILELTGGNRGLAPETAKTWTLGVDYDSKRVEGLSASVTYFSIAYRNRLGQLANPFTALTDPLNAPFVLRAPSASYVEGLIDSADYLINLARAPINPANIPAIVDFRTINVSSEDVFGSDIGLKYRKASSFGVIEPFANVALLDLRQRLTPLAAEVEISGRIFEPAKIRARSGVSWLDGPWAVTGIVNYSGAEVNTYQPTLPRVGAWTTTDFNLAFRPDEAGALRGLALSLSIENAFNRDPPYLVFDQYIPGIHYDPLNANVLGRVIRLGASWTLQ